MSDLARATSWCRRVLEPDGPDVEPADGVVELQVGPVWLQLDEGSTERSGAEVVLRLGVDDAAAERDHLVDLGVEVGPLTHVEGAVDVFGSADPDGNRLSMDALVGRP